MRPLDPALYSAYEAIARRRLARRDEQDWPILAAALALECPIWTEDADLAGVADLDHGQDRAVSRGIALR